MRPRFTTLTGALCAISLFASSGGGALAALSEKQAGSEVTGLHWPRRMSVAGNGDLKCYECPRDNYTQCQNQWQSAAKFSASNTVYETLTNEPTQFWAVRKDDGEKTKILTANILLQSGETVSIFKKANSFLWLVDGAPLVGANDAGFPRVFQNVKVKRIDVYDGTNWHQAKEIDIQGSH